MLQLFKSQESYLARLDGKPYMFAEPGSGKTLMSIYRAYREGAYKLLIICPATVRDTHQWQQEIEKSGLQFDEVEVQSHAYLQKYKTLNLPSKYADYFIIIDEAHRIANSQSKQGQGAYHLIMQNRAGYLLLSGTPMSKWADAVNYAKITGLVKHKTEFYKRFVVEQPSYAHKGKDIVGYRDTDTLIRWWDSIATRGRAEEFVELPKAMKISVDIPIKRKGYIEMIKTRTRDGEPLDSAPKLNWALRQYAETAPEKLKWVVEKIQDLDNAIVFCNTIAAMDTLSEQLTKAGIKHGIWCGKRKDKFEDQDVMIVQYQSGGTGLNLQKFNATIFLSPCYSFIDYVQAVKRTHRTGQTERCLFYQLKAVNTIDGAIYRALAAKADFDDKLVGVDNIMEVLG